MNPNENSLLRNSPDEVLIKLIALSNNFNVEIRSIVMDMAGLRAELKNLAEQQTRLNQVVIQGNGRESILSTIVRIEERGNRLIADFNEHKKLLEEKLSKLVNQNDLAELKEDIVSMQKSIEDFKNQFNKNVTTSDGNTTINVKKKLDWGDNQTKIILGVIAAVSTLVPVVISYVTTRNTPPQETQPKIEQPSPSPTLKLNKNNLLFPGGR